MTAPAPGGVERRRAWIVGWALLTVFVVIAARGVEWGRVVDLAATASIPLLALAVLANAGILLFAASQWMLLLPRGAHVRFRTMAWVTAIASTVSNGGPFMAGHAAGIHLLATRGGVGYPTAVSVKATEQFAEGISKLTLVVVAVAVSPLSAEVRGGVVGLLVLVTAFGGLLLVGAHRGHHLERWGEGGSGWRSKFARFLGQVATQLEVLRRPRVFLLALLVGLGKKVAEGIGIACVFWAVGLTVPLWGVVVVLAAVALSTMASVTPANIGIYEGSAVVALGLLGVPSDVAVGVAILQHAVYLIPVAGTGWIVILATGLRPSRLTSLPMADERSR